MEEPRVDRTEYRERGNPLPETADRPSPWVAPGDPRHSSHLVRTGAGEDSPSALLTLERAGWRSKEIARSTVAQGRRASGPKARGDSHTVNWLIRGLARCTVCGSICSATPSSKTSRHAHAGYYVCRKRLAPGDGVRCVTSPFVRQAEADTLVERATLAHFKALRASLSRPPPPRQSGANFSEQRAKNKAARGRVVALVSQGVMNVTDVAGEVARLDHELIEIEATEADYAAEATDDTVESRRGALGFVEKAASTWEGLPVSGRRAVIAALAHQIAIGPENGTSMVWCDAPTLAAAFARGTLPDLDDPAAAAPEFRKRPRVA